MPRTLVIGLDAANWAVVDRLVDEDRLPTIAGLLEDGVSGTLRSTKPPMTPAAWTSMSTGTNPGRHGIFDFFDQDRESYDISPVDYGGMPCPTVWGLLNDENVSVGIINYPLVNPPAEVDEFFVSGIPSSADVPRSHPEAVRDMVARTGFRNHPTVPPKAGNRAYFDELVDITEAQRDLTLATLDRYDVDLLWSVFMAPDWAQHYLWDASIDGNDAVASVYELVDSVVSDITDAVEEPCNVVLVSDHGARRIRREVHLNTLLEELGYLSLSDGADSSLKTSAVERLIGLFYRSPEGVQRAIRSVLPGRLRRSVARTAGRQTEVNQTIEWEETRVFSYGYMGRLFIHDSERFASGQVDPDDRQRLKVELVEEFESLTDPRTGDRLIETIVDIPEHYDGSFVERAPDLLLEPVDWRYSLYGNTASRWIHDPTDRIADHDPEGMFVASGPDFACGSVSAHVTDIAPTLLALHDVPVPDGMDGRIILDAVRFDEADVERVESTSWPTERRERAISERERETIENRLGDLGYR